MKKNEIAIYDFHFPIGEKQGEKGLALVIVLLITAVLVAVITEIVYAVHIHIFTTNSYKESQQASLMAEGGIELGSKGLKEMMKEKAYTYFKEGENERIFREGKGILNIKAEDEQGKISLNTIVYTNGEINKEYYNAYLRLLKILGLDEGLADTLADWIDINDNPRVGGGETSDYYQRLNPAYRAKNNYLDSIEELLLIKGYTLEIYKKILPFVTVYTDGRVNINTASKEVIAALHWDLTFDTAQRIIDYRKKEPFNDTADIRKVSGFETIGFNLQGRITVKSNIFRIFSRADSEDVVKEVEAVIETGENDKTRFWRQR